jgi:hypothetical protein
MVKKILKNHNYQALKEHQQVLLTQRLVLQHVPQVIIDVQVSLEFYLQKLKKNKIK